MLELKKKRRRERFNLSLDAENYSELKRIAEKEEVNYSDIIDDLIEKFLKGYGDE